MPEAGRQAGRAHFQSRPQSAPSPRPSAPPAGPARPQLRGLRGLSAGGGPPSGEARAGLSVRPQHPGIPHLAAQTPLPPHSRRRQASSAPPAAGPARLPLPSQAPSAAPTGPEGVRQVPPAARGRGRSSGSGRRSAVSARGRCALGTGRRWLAPWLRLLSRRRLLLPVARAAGRSGVLVSDAAEV